MNLYKRWQKENIEEALESRRVVLLNGPRQCGKTTLVKELVSSEVEYRTLDDALIRSAASFDPHNFVQHKLSTLIIDEIQRVPDLLIAIKNAVDEDTRPGQYLLTGSANIYSIPTVKESLAGRIRKMRLRTLTQGEIRGAKPGFLHHAFDQDFNYKFSPVGKDVLLQMASRGGFPEALKLNDRQRYLWHQDYISVLLDRDLREIAHIQRHDVLKHLVEILAAWSSKYLDISAIGSGLGVKWETLQSYINALEALYLVDRVSPWRNTGYDRVGKKPKIFMNDCGLMFSLLNLNLDELVYNSDATGKLMETFVFNELSAQIEAHPGMYELFHYRDRDQREIDFLIVKEDRSILAVEVKSSSLVTGNDFKHISWFQEHMTSRQPFTGIVLYSGDRVVSFGKNQWAVPLSMLWPLEG
jgi:predicted AAA+ superfamily ATPase